MEKFQTVVMGSMDPQVFGGYMFIALFAATLLLLIRANNKKHQSLDTPDDFKLWFFIKDNLLKFIINIMVIALAIRFSNEMVGSEITGWLSVVIGAGVNTLVVKLQSIENSARN